MKTTKLDYSNALAAYYRKTRGHVSVSILHKVEDDAQIIDEYEKNNPTLEKHEIVVRILLNALAHLAWTALYSSIILYVLREVFKVEVEYEIKSIALLCAVFLGYNVKFRLFV